MIHGKLIRGIRFALTALLCTAAASAFAQGKQPNLVFILADNVGYGDMGAYGGGELRGMPTPVADRLANEGLTLTQFLVEPSCTPSRAALMTGQYSIRNGLSLFIIPGTPNTLPAQRLHHGPALQGRRVCHRALRQVASRHRAAKPADGARIRHLLRHSAGLVVERFDDGAGNLRDPQRREMRPSKNCSQKGPWIMEQVVGRPAEEGEALHAGGTCRDRRRPDEPVGGFHQEPGRGQEAVLPLSAVLGGPRADPAVEGLRGQVAHRAIRRQDHGGRPSRRPGARRAEGGRRR